ncbi:hypothetical protein HYC85_030013 [Camellia sinensis]|uniref:Uncharacterized protein n=1 Tax=Camellia sinensis TaxID=4442 RepID=A0A7J7FZJ6_CAMSI|nr:hypothetical protein HYC85_030013 [Camellia sinensis]
MILLSTCASGAVALTSKQSEALVAALECSRVHFIWCMKASDQGHMASDDGVIPNGFKDHVGDGGFIIEGQTKQVFILFISKTTLQTQTKHILRHRAMGVFMTHYGWSARGHISWGTYADVTNECKLVH